MSETITKPNRKLLQAHMTSSEYIRQDMIAQPERGTDLEEMLEPAYWANVANRLRPLDRIEVRPADGRWWAILLVRTVEPFAVRVVTLNLIRFDQDGSSITPSMAPEGFEYKHRGTQGWSVIRKADGVVLREKEQSIEGAAAWLTAHLRKLAV